jgi:hypothetical protein
MRKHTRRRVLNPVPPWLRPRLTADQQLDLGLAHWQNLDALAKGEGTVDLLWQVVGGVLTWSRAAELLHARNASYEPAVAQMTDQLALAERLVQRYRATGRVLLTGPDYQLAKQGADVMDQLAAVVDRATAVAAAEWSERRVNEWATQGPATPVFLKAPAIAEADVPY